MLNTSGSKNQVTTVKHAKSNDKRSSSMKGHQRNETTGETSTERVTWVTKDASYLTKTQLSKILLTVNSENHQAASVEGKIFDSNDVLNCFEIFCVT